MMGNGTADAPNASIFSAPNTKFDPAVASLFNSSAGPTQILPKPTARSSKRTVSLESKPISDFDVTTSADRSVGEEVSTSDDETAKVKKARGLPVENEPPRKKRKVSKNDDIESSYLNRLLREEVKEQKQKRHDRARSTSTSTGTIVPPEDSPPASVEGGDRLDEEAHIQLPRHETLLDPVESAGDDQQRTVFLSNVSVEAIKTSSAKKILTKHLQTALEKSDEDPVPKLNNIRFRSTAYVSDAGPKRAAYAKKELMDDTTRSTNAYAVFSSASAAKMAATKLNGTVVLERHLRVDYLGKPAEVDHKRCVFVGNLSFVDLESADDTNKNGESTPKRPRSKTPADVEEGLWRTFGKVGRVENVRVVRDKETRVSKGFAYVQFVDENAVEAALLLEGKRFPPHLPRTLRVMRAKRPNRPKRLAPTTGAGKRGQTLGSKFGGVQRRSGRSGGGGGDGGGGRGRARKSNFVFEGQRATAGVGTSKGKKRHAVKPTDRSARRAAAYKAAGGKKHKSDA